jgi:hypothetical protein
MKIRPVGTELSDADGGGRTAMTKLLFAFRNSARAPKQRRSTVSALLILICHILQILFESRSVKRKWIARGASIL